MLGLSLQECNLSTMAFNPQQPVNRDHLGRGRFLGEFRCFRVFRKTTVLLVVLVYFMLVCVSRNLRPSPPRASRPSLNENESNIFNFSFFQAGGQLPEGVGTDCVGRHNTTVVTVYFNIGAFAKGDEKNIRPESVYFNWLRSFASLMNPLVFVTDDHDVLLKLLNWRRQRNENHCTIARVLQRDQLWPWRHLDDIATALRERPYVYSPPCTTSPAYVAAVNSKYPIVEITATENPFRTNHIVWLDAGIYRWRNESELNSSYLIEPLADLAPTKIGYLEMYKPKVATFEEVFLDHIDWIAGGVFFGQTQRMALLAREYSSFAKTFMTTDYVGADQQVLAAIFMASDVNSTIGTPKSQLQIYPPYPRVTDDEWFNLAHLVRKRVDV